MKRFISARQKLRKSFFSRTVRGAQEEGKRGVYKWIPSRNRSEEKKEVKRWNGTETQREIFFHFLSHFLGFPFLLFLWFVPATQKGELEPRKEHEYVWHKTGKKKQDHIMSGYFGQDNLGKRSCPKKVSAPKIDCPFGSSSFSSFNAPPKAMNRAASLFWIP